MRSVLLLELAASVALPLGGLHMIHSGIVRGFGSDLRRIFGSALRNRFLAFLARVGVMALPQSNAAAGLMMRQRRQQRQ